MPTSFNSIRLARQMTRATEVCLAEIGWWMIPPPSDDHAVPFLRVVGALREWSTGLISDRALARCLRKAAWEVGSGH